MCQTSSPKREAVLSPLSHKTIFFFKPHLITDKQYIVVVLCLLVTVNQWKQFNLLFPGTTCFTFLLRGIFGVLTWERPLALGWRFTTIYYYRLIYIYYYYYYYYITELCFTERYAWQSQLLLDRDCDLILVNRAALLLTSLFKNEKK